MKKETSFQFICIVGKINNWRIDFRLHLILVHFDFGLLSQIQLIWFSLFSTLELQEDYIKQILQSIVDLFIKKNWCLAQPLDVQKTASRMTTMQFICESFSWFAPHHFFLLQFHLLLVATLKFQYWNCLWELDTVTLFTVSKMQATEYLTIRHYCSLLFYLSWSEQYSEAREI